MGKAFSFLTHLHKKALLSVTARVHNVNGGGAFNLYGSVSCRLLFQQKAAHISPRRFFPGAGKSLWQNSQFLLHQTVDSAKNTEKETKSIKICQLDAGL